MCIRDRPETPDPVYFGLGFVVKTAVFMPCTNVYIRVIIWLEFDPAIVTAFKVLFLLMVNGEVYFFDAAPGVDPSSE